MSIRAEALGKAFAGRVVVDRLTLEVAPGEIYGLIGPNGAGKTTTLRMLAGLLRPDTGRALVCGVDAAAAPERAKARLGFLTGTTGLYERLTPVEMLRYFGDLHGVPRPVLARRIEALLAELRVTHLADRRCGKLSTGERQRVSLARAIVHDPEALILDEPTSGLDVLASRFAADFIRRARGRGRSVLLSTHYMSEAELLCDRIGLLHRGRIHLEGTPAAVKEALGASTLEEAFLAVVAREELGEAVVARAELGEAEPPRDAPP